jgi:hypothetical protein
MGSNSSLKKELFSGRSKMSRCKGGVATNKDRLSATPPSW